MKLEKIVQVKNPLGLHIRPATVIVQLLQNVKSSVKFSCRRETIDARSVLSILMLAAKKNSQITIIVDGEDATMTMEKLVAAFEAGFGENSDEQ